MRTIHKYVLQLTDQQRIEVPSGAEFLTAQIQRGKICVWAIVDTDKKNDLEYFLIVGTGQPIPDKPQFLQFVGTVQQQGDPTFVWHIFRAGK